MERRSLFDDAVYDECRSRVGHLRRESAARWGAMSAAQMLAHCAEVQEVANGKPLVGTPWLLKLIAPLIRRSVVSEKAYPRGVRTHPQYRQAAERQFDEEKDRLLASLDALRAARLSPVPHPLFGTLSEAESGWASYKHLDHHLEQFGV